MAIPRSTVSMHHIGSPVEDIEMGMKASDFRWIADFLNGLYSNVIAAPVREYSTNAWDSHVAAGVTRPIEIFLPTEGDLNFVVQDFGLGMSIDDIRNTYANYGASTKRESNDVAGQLGLGSKSGLSYADGFTVTAVKDHEKVSAFVTKNEQGLGVIKILTPPAATNESNGVRIQIPVEAHDVDRFRREAENLFRFWEPNTVLIDGEAPKTPEWMSGALHIDEHLMLVRDDAGVHSSYVIMGNVPYPVDDVQVGRTSQRFVARLNIGDVDFVPSREDLKYTEWTEETLADLEAHINLRFKVTLDNALSNVASRWDETLLRSVWKGSLMNLTRSDYERSIWTYDPTRWHRKAQAHQSYQIRHLMSPKTVVVTHFTAKNLSATARDRLVEFAGSTNFVIVPTGVKVGMLDGRPNTYRWDEIVGVTTKPKASKGSRGPKVETRYSIVNKPSMTAAELAEVDGPVLYLAPNEGTTHGSLDATVVCLYSMNQINRLRRFVPHIAPYQDEVDRRRKAAAAAVTPRDRDIVRARDLAGAFLSLDPNAIDDAELAGFIALALTDDTPTMVEARRFNIQIRHPKPLPDFGERYPLATPSVYGVANNVLIAERTLYINARYNANQAAALMAAFSHGAVA